MAYFQLYTIPRRSIDLATINQVISVLPISSNAKN